MAVDALLEDGRAEPTRPRVGRALRVLGTCTLLWFGPIALLAVVLGGGHVLLIESTFFSKAAVVTFGGAYAVLGASAAVGLIARLAVG